MDNPIRAFCGITRMVENVDHLRHHLMAVHKRIDDDYFAHRGIISSKGIQLRGNANKRIEVRKIVRENEVSYGLCSIAKRADNLRLRITFFQVSINVYEIHNDLTRPSYRDPPIQHQSTLYFNEYKNNIPLIIGKTIHKDVQL